MHAAQKHRSRPRMIGAGVGSNASGGRMRQVGHDRNTVAEFLERAEDLGELEALPSVAGVHLSIVAPCGT